MTQRRVFGVILQLIGALIAIIIIAALLGWTPRLVHPWLMVTLMVAALASGFNMYRGKGQSDT